MRSEPLANIRTAARLNAITPGQMLFKRYADRVRQRLSMRKTKQQGVRRRRSSILANLHSAARRGVTFDSQASFQHRELPEEVSPAVDRWQQSVADVVLLLQGAKAFQSSLADRKARLQSFTIQEARQAAPSLQLTNDPDISACVPNDYLSVVTHCVCSENAESSI